MFIAGLHADQLCVITQIDAHRSVSELAWNLPLAVMRGLKLRSRLTYKIVGHYD